MNKQIIEVPYDVRYISDWIDFDITLLQGHSIINKTITGCGFTHYCLTNNIPTILCSPRKFLLENKHEQLTNTFLIINNGELNLGIDNEFCPLKKQSNSNNQDSFNEDYQEILLIQNNLRSYLVNSQAAGLVPKILVTYDSLKYVLGVIGELIPYYSIIVDEFQNIFIDASFKSDTELNFIETLQDCPNVTYLSATPYIEEYLNELDEFKDLYYYEFKWHPNRLQTIKVDMRKTFRPSQEIDKIIQDYLEGRYPEKVDENGTVHQSKEVVFYTNSVKLITSTIKRNKLTPDQVNIICADTEKNKKSLRNIKFDIGKAPRKGKPHKMFTFCTRTTYAGADFYSPSALSVIVSDCKIDSLSTDIRMDFPQIMGRQRLLENVFRDECIFIYCLSDKEVTMEEHEKRYLSKLEESRKDLENYNVLISSGAYSDKFLKDIRTRIRLFNYKDDYTGISAKEGKPIINKLVLISERRAFELRSSVYKSEVQVYNEFAKVTSPISHDSFLERVSELNRIRSTYNTKGSFEHKMKLVCDFLLDPKWYGKIYISDFYWLPLNYRNYLNLIGPERIRANGYIEADIKKEISLLGCGDILKSEVIKLFNPGSWYSSKNIKQKLGDLYKFQSILRTPKATDILDFFEVKEYLGLDKETGKRSRGYEIIKIKD